MLFIEPRFFVFLTAVCAVHWLLRGERVRKVWLLLASYVFYAAWDWRFLGLILFSTFVDYAVGMLLARTERQATRRRWLLVSLAANLGILGFFKYYGFFVVSAGDLLQWLGLGLHVTTLHIVLPIGISFYTFQTLSYSIDVFRRKIEPTRDILDLALFVGFFPQLVAGPIVRAADFLPQLQAPRNRSDVRWRVCLTLFLIGFFKKVCVSDNLAPTVDAYFAAPELYSALSAWIATVFFAIQIYCDFSGYSDMAIACAGLLGYRLCRNFNHPYLAHSISDFWHRWHISLSTWLRDYLYIPLGGSRGTTLRTCRNLLLTMLLGGLWHGAAWTFVVWGGLHGIALVAHKLWNGFKRPIDPTPLQHRTGTLLTLYWVLLTWIFFRAADLETAWIILKAFVLLQAQGSTQLGFDLVWCIPVLYVVHWFASRRDLTRRWTELGDWVFAGLYSLATSLVFAFAPAGQRAFIYFQF